jgi:hypothetical protein
MSESQAMLGYGSVLELADIATPTVRQYIAEVSNFTLPSSSTDQVDVTHMQSPGKSREFIDGLTDNGEFGFEMNYVPGSQADQRMIAAKGKRKRVYITFPNGVQVSFTGSRQSYEKSAATDDKMTASASFKVSGDPIQTPAAAPRSLAVPAITGTASVGSPLELDRGIWAGALDVTVQWQKDEAGNSTFVDIVDATGLAYVPATSDIGDKIRAEVTASNGSFTTVANSIATAAVVAAV